MAIVVECPRCRHATHFADNDAGLAVSCTACGQVTRVPDPRPRRAAPPPLKLTPTKMTGARAAVYAAGTLLVLGTAGGLGFLKYRLVVRDRSQQSVQMPLATPTADATPQAITSASVQPPIPQPSPRSVVERDAVESKPVPARQLQGPARAIGFIGLERLELNGRYTVDSYNSAADPYHATAARSAAPVLSNQKIRLYGEGSVRGVVQVGRSGDLRRDDAVRLSPYRHSHQPIDAPAVNSRSIRFPHNNENLPTKYFRSRDLTIPSGKTLALPAGTYDLDDLVIEPNATLILDGPATFVLGGKLTLYGNIETHQNRPPNLQIRIDSLHEPVTINNESHLFLDLYAPKNPIEIQGKGDIHGSIVGQTLRMYANRDLHFDESIAATLSPLKTQTLTP